MNVTPHLRGIRRGFRVMVQAIVGTLPIMIARYLVIYIMLNHKY